MMGSDDITSPEAGLIPRICRDILQLLNPDKLNKQISISERVIATKCDVAFIEIYNEKVYDLLSPISGVASRVRQHPTEGAFVEDLTRDIVVAYTDVQRVLDEGKKRRRTAMTLMNAESSRSHAVFIIYLWQKLKMENGFGSFSDIERTSKVSLVDLAGSERAATTGAVGERMKEAASINKSLSVLGDVIKALSERAPKAGLAIGGGGVDVANTLAISGEKDFVPYRNSILTWLLKDSLGGNSRTTMLATVSPIDRSYVESLSTLKYVERAKLIVNNAAVNAHDNSMESKEVKQMMQQITVLKSQHATLVEKMKYQEQQFDASTKKMKIEVENQYKNRVVTYVKRIGALEDELAVAYDAEKEGITITKKRSFSEVCILSDYYFCMIWAKKLPISTCKLAISFLSID